jgi:hypothetical protein
MTYRSNSKAWMLATIFQEWLQDFDYKIYQKYKGERVLLLVDNCSSHKTLGLNLQYVELHFYHQILHPEFNQWMLV